MPASRTLGSGRTLYCPRGGRQSHATAEDIASRVSKETPPPLPWVSRPVTHLRNITPYFHFGGNHVIAHLTILCKHLVET
ncbi:hypothetical protein ElyMa_001812700 [Elysia marginata]|uniref:Uncharacterized protein n=1 Tax=Elysia marginata TaxID=1093978 RepID=A0AAV4EH88_9GAST|nr:hypothetical protein ElyMa_001812700 [Elysia marginata]